MKTLICLTALGSAVVAFSATDAAAGFGHDGYGSAVGYYGQSREVHCRYRGHYSHTNYGRYSSCPTYPSYPSYRSRPDCPTYGYYPPAPCSWKVRRYPTMPPRNIAPTQPQQQIPQQAPAFPSPTQPTVPNGLSQPPSSQFGGSPTVPTRPIGFNPGGQSGVAQRPGSNQTPVPASLPSGVNTTPSPRVAPQPGTNTTPQFDLAPRGKGGNSVVPRGLPTNGRPGFLGR